jgi:hypothetical protein
VRLVATAIAALLVAPGCKEKPRPVPDATPDPIAVVDSGPDVDPTLAMVADAVASLEALEDSGVDADPASLASIQITYGAAKVTPKGALDPAAELARGRFRFRGCVVVSDAGALPPAGIVLTIKVGEGGEVTSVTSKDKGAIAECFVAAARRMRFEEPTSGSASVEVPVVAIRR